MTKSDIRNEMLKLRDGLNPLQVNLLSNTITDNLCALDEYVNASIIYMYASYRNEADTTALIDRALSDGKRVALPCSYMSGGEPRMDFYFINSRTDLVSGYKGIMEPDRRKLSITKTEIPPDIFIIPGIAFDKNMNRLGYGKGFYDKYLSLHNFGAVGGNTNASSDISGKSYAIPILIGLCYGFQTAFEIPADETDIKMHMLITENGVINDGRSSKTA